MVFNNDFVIARRNDEAILIVNTTKTSFQGNKQLRQSIKVVT